MKKLFTKIVGISLGIAMAIGVGVGAANSSNFKSVYAAAGDVKTFTVNITNVNAAADKSADWPTGYSNTQVTWSQTVGGVTMGFAIANFTTGTGTNAGTMQNRVNAAGCSYMVSTSLTSGYAILSVQGASSTARNWDFYGATSTISVTNDNPAVVTGGTKVGNTNTNNSEHSFGSGATYNAANYPYTHFAMVRTGSNAGYYTSFTIKVVELESGGDPAPTVDSVSLSGSMSTTSYTTVQSWSNTGLTANVIMSDSSIYDGDVNWSYSPATPAAAVIANSKNEVTGGSVTATASAGGQTSNNKVTGGISVSYATVAQLAAVTPASGSLTGVIAKGIVSQVDEINLSYHNATYWISDDGTTTNQYEVFRGKGVDNANLTNNDDIKVGDVVVVYGNVTTYNSTKEFESGNYLLSLDREEPADSVVVTLNTNSLNFDLYTSTSNTLTATVETSGSATNGLTAESDDELVATISTNEPSSGVAFTVTAVGVGTAHITVTSVWDTNVSASCTVTVVDTTPRLANFKKVDSLVSGQRVLITSVVGDNYYYLPSTATGGSTAPSAVACTYNSVSQRIVSADANKVFVVGGNSSGWTFTNDSGDKLYVTNNNNGVRVGGTTHAFTATATANGFYLQSTTLTRFIGIYNEADWRSYNTSSHDNYEGSGESINFWVEAKPEQTISGATSAFTINTVALTSTAGTPTWSIVAGDTTAPGASITDAGVVSVTGAGVVRVKASHNDYEDAYYTITFTVKPENPFIDPSKDSTNGYTGQNETLSFTYGNLTGSLNIASNDEDVVTVETPSYSDGSGTVRINFVGAGSTTVSFNDGSTELDSVSVSVATSSVVISGMPASQSMENGKTLNLGALITVTNTGIYSNSLTWSSSVPGVALVNSSGVVTACSAGSTVITASPDDYPAGAVSCTITVANLIKTTLIAGTDVGSTTESVSKYAVTVSTASGEGTFTRDDNYRVYSGKDVTISSSQGNIVKIEFACTSEANHKLEGDGYVKNGANGVWTGDASSVTLNSNGAQTRINKIIVTLKSQAIAGVNDTESASALKFNYDQIDDTFTYTGVNIRFGGFISKTLWNSLDAEAGIQGYGVMVAAKDNLGGQTIKERYVAAKTNENTVEQAINSICSTYSIGKVIVNIPDDKESPATATAEQKAFMGVDSGDYYVWTVRKSIGSGFTTKYNAVAFILIDGDIVFLDEVSLSAKDIATRDVPSNPSNPDRPALIYMRDN